MPTHIYIEPQRVKRASCHPGPGRVKPLNIDRDLYRYLPAKKPNKPEREDRCHCESAGGRLCDRRRSNGAPGPPSRRSFYDCSDRAETGSPTPRQICKYRTSLNTTHKCVLFQPASEIGSYTRGVGGLYFSILLRADD